MCNAIDRKESTGPKERYHNVQRIHRFFLNNCNIELYDAQSSSTADSSSYPFIAFNGVAISLIIFSILTKDLDVVLMNLAYFGFAIQGIPKFLVFFKFGKRMRLIVTFLDRVYCSAETRRSNYRILDEATKILERLVKCFIALMVFCFTCQIGFGLLFYRHGKLILPFRLPGFNDSTNVGFRANALFQLIGILFSLNVVCFADMLYGIWVFHLLPLSKIIHCNVSHLNERIKKSSAVTIKLWLRNIVKMHMDFYW